MRNNKLRWICGAVLAGALISTPLAAGVAADAPAPVTGAFLRGLDKTTARVTDLKVDLGQTIHFGTLDVTLKDCRKNAPEESTENAAYLDVSETRPGETSAQHLFGGWMFSSSPALSALEHPIYDIWVIDCMTSKGSADKSG